MVSMNSAILGGQLPAFAASARSRLRSPRSAYGQTWMISLSGPISVCQNAASGETFLRCS
jgi:hypothetical protein